MFYLARRLFSHLRSQLKCTKLRISDFSHDWWLYGSPLRQWWSCELWPWPGSNLLGLRSSEDEWEALRSTAHIFPLTLSERWKPAAPLCNRVSLSASLHTQRQSEGSVFKSLYEQTGDVSMTTSKVKWPCVLPNMTHHWCMNHIVILSSWYNRN